MRELLARRRPSPATVIAFIALLVALSGTAVALPGRNTVDSGDIKNRVIRNQDLRDNAVTGAKVRGNSLTGSDVRSLGGGDVNDNALTGNDIDEASLGQVPQAASAGAVNGITRVPQVTIPVGATQQIASKGPLTLSLVCTDTGGGNIQATMQMTTTASNAAASSEIPGDTDGDLDPGDSPAMGTTPADTGQTLQHTDWVALTPGGQRFDGSGWVGANFQGTPGCVANVLLFDY